MRSARLTPGTNALGVSIARQVPQTVRHLAASVYGGSAPCRLLVLDGPAPSDLTNIAAWDASAALPANAADALGVGQPLYEVIVPPNTFIDVPFTSGAGGGPTGGTSGGLTILLVPFVVAGASACYASLAAYGADAIQSAHDEATTGRSVLPSIFG